MNISYEGIGHVSVTFPAGGCVTGQVCKLDTEGKAAACAAGEVFCGLTESVRGTQAGVQIHGFAKIAYTGTAPAVGYTKLSADGSGGIQADDGGRACLVAQVDTNAMTVVVEL